MEIERLKLVFLIQYFVSFSGVVECQVKGSQVDPCTLKSKIAGDETYCDRYWECVNGQPELYDCPNGLVYAGKNRGVTEGCDYPWRSNYCEGKQQASKYNYGSLGFMPSIML